MKKSDIFKNQYGPWALITGAASGIGAEFCRQIASFGVDCVMVDIQGEMLSNHARLLSSDLGIRTRPIIADLADSDFLDRIRAVTDDLDIGLLINNAGYGSIGNFLSTDLDDMLRTLKVNCRAPLILTYHFGRPMTVRGRGGIIFLSSTSACQGTPLVANYAATKAYNLILAEALWDELRNRNVDILSVLPGPTNTPAFNSVNPCMDAVRGMPYIEPEQVVSEALQSLGRRPSLIAGKANRIIGFIMSRLLSRKGAIKTIGKNTRLLYPYAAEE